MKTLRWFLWAVRGWWPKSDEKYKAWLQDRPDDGLASPEPSSSPSGGDVRDQAEPDLRFTRKVEDGTQRTLTAEQWKSYNHRYVRDAFDKCAKCEEPQAYRIHWIAAKLAEHIAEGGTPTDFLIPVHEFWKTSSIDACGVCGRPLDHVNHADNVLASPLPGASKEGSALEREGL